MNLFMLESKCEYPGKGGGGLLIECEYVNGQSAVRDSLHCSHLSRRMLIAMMMVTTICTGTIIKTHGIFVPPSSFYEFSIICSLQHFYAVHRADDDSWFCIHKNRKIK